MLLLCLAILIVAIAGPRQGRQQTVADTEGIAIQLVVDRSGSMRAMDFQKQGQPIDRLTAIKDVAGRFVLGAEDDALAGRFNDVLGLITFAGAADSVTPPTLDHAFLVARLNEAQIVDRRSEDGTAIGDAIGLAIEKLMSLDRKQIAAVKSKIVILLTDGENNSGDLKPIAAADLAKTMDIKIYTIGVGTKGRAPFPVTDAYGRQIMRWTEVNIDEDALRQIADKTGGKYFRATDTRSLKSIYAEIDQLEKSNVQERQYVDYREFAIQPVQFGSLVLPPLGQFALVLLGVQLVLKHAVFRRFG